MITKRQEIIYTELKKGKSIKELASAYSVSEETILKEYNKLKEKRKWLNN